jgi:molybdopterin synthase catalytic subunit
MLENCHAATAYHEAGHAVLAHITGVYTIHGNIVIIGGSPRHRSGAA